MSIVEYSREAVNILNKFHRCEKLIYVEGDDDVLFWSTIFNCFGFSSIKIEKKDGSNELDKYTDRLINEDLNIIIARDSDYKVITGRMPYHHRLITTYGYSIENTLYVPEAVVELVKIWIKDIEFREEEFNLWIDGFTSDIELLILFDIVNDYYELYVDVLGDNCTRYMKTQACSNIDVDKVEDCKNRLQPVFSEEQVENISSIINRSEKSLYEVVRGHFLQSAILKFIASCIMKKKARYNLSYDALYTNAIQQLRLCFNEDHRHYQHYKDEIESATKAA